MDSEYYTLPPGQCTANKSFQYDDVDGVWIDGKFYALKDTGFNACNPKESKKCFLWNKDANSLNSPHHRGAADKYGDSPPKDPPIYILPNRDPPWEK
jgi:hypothetical protein